VSIGAAIPLFEQSVAGVYALGLDGRVLYINAHLADILGYVPEEIVGHSFFEFVDDEDLAARRATFARISSGEVTSLQNVGIFKRRDGDVRDILTESTLADYDGVPAIIGIATDVTERTRAQHDLQRANRALQTLSGANSAMMRARSELELLHDMCDVAFATGNYQLAWAGIADPDRSVRPVANAGAGAETLAQAQIRWDDSPQANGPTGLTIRTGMPVVMRELDSDPHVQPWKEFYKGHGHRAIAALPLKDANGVFGSFTLSSRDPRAFDAEELDLLTKLADDISYGIAALRNRAALFEAEEQYRKHSTRLEALWRIVNNPRLTGDELWLAMLAEAAAAIRPGYPYVGALFLIQGGEIIVEAVAETAEYAATQRGSGMQVGMRVPLTGTALETVTERGVGTFTWEDLRTAFDTPLIQRFGWRSSICTTFEQGAGTYMLWFASTEQTGTWEPLDRAYAEVVASFFSNQAQLHWQFERIQYQQTHDVLTNVLNRSHFRSQARMASITDGTFAVISMNLNNFSAVNETYGSMIGDALLVEVAAGLFERAAQGEIVGRLGGDVFAIYVPAPHSTDFVRQRAIDFAERFRNPFSTGDREGKEFIALTATFGIAVAPEHGTTVDGVVSHANAAVTAAKARGRGIVLVYEPGMEADA